MPSSRPSAPARAFALAVAVLLLAAAARILGADAPPLWTDEGASLVIAENPLEHLAEDHHPPLYFFALNGWSALAGDSRLALRFPAILAGVLAAAVIYRTGREWLNRPAALAGTALFAVSDLAIEYTRQARHYGWLVLGVALSSWLFLRVLRRPTAAALALYALSLLFLFYSHYLGFLIFPLHALVGLFVWRASHRDRLRLAGAWTATALLYLPWLVAVQHLLLLARESGLASRPGVSLSSLAALGQMAAVLADNQTALVFGFAALAAWRVAAERRWTPGRTARLYLLAAGAGLFAGMFVLNYWLRVLTPRTLVFLTPALYLTAGYGLSFVPRRAAVMLVGAAVVFALLSTAVIQPRYQADVAAAALAAHYQPGDLIVLETGFDDNAFAYELRRALNDPAAAIIRTLPWISERFEVRPVVPEIAGELAASRRVWVVQWLHAAQALPYLRSGESGFYEALALEIPIGEQYEDLFPDPYIDLVLFERAG